MIIDDLFIKKLTDMSQNDNLKFLPLRTSWHGMTLYQLSYQGSDESSLGFLRYASVMIACKQI